MNWKKPVICIFKERSADERQADPFVVLKAKQLTLISAENFGFSGKLVEFFTLMGDADYLSTPEGKVDHYVLCWFDDTEPDMTKDLRRLRGVRFNGEVTHTEAQNTHKRTYNAHFTAEQGKIK
ncbi:MAG TPA: hypothetical protein VLH35_06130 [Candidatus Acidoferrales bacterium]|nr:hypothetical protein [Candidatus Acidoferrales bacterium]